MQNKIILKGLRLYAYHGVMEQERKEGAYFTIDGEVVTHLALLFHHSMISIEAQSFEDDFILHCDCRP